MNVHEECLGRAQDHLEGRLDAAGHAAVVAHASACPDCRAVLARWPVAAPVPRLAPAVLAAIRAESSVGRTGEAAPTRGWVLALASALALALVFSAFWHPERQWARDDGAAAGRPASTVPALRGAPWLAD